MTELAIDGGKPYRSEPFPRRVLYGDEEVRMAEAAIRSQDLFQWSGHYVRDFETKIADFYGVGHAATSTSGTSAIHIAVGTIDPNPGDEIITAPITDLGSVTPILQQTAVPVFADIDPATFTMDPADIERKITDRTKAILVVHLFGNACDMDAVMDIAGAARLAGYRGLQPGSRYQVQGTLSGDYWRHRLFQPAGKQAHGHRRRRRDDNEQ